MFGCDDLQRNGMIGIKISTSVGVCNTDWYCPPCRELYNRIVVTFIDKNLPGDTGVTLTLNQRMTYPIVRLSLSSITTMFGLKLQILIHKKTFSHFFPIFVM